MELETIGNALATGLAVGGGFIGMAWKADGLLSDEIKEDISLWLMCAELKSEELYARKWPKYISTLFDRIFTEKHLSWKCFWRSCVASFSSLILLTLILYQVAPPTAIIEERGLIVTTLIVVILGALLNFIPDYLSLLETRFIIGKIQNARLLSMQVIWLGLDLLLTTIILMLTFAVFAVIVIVLSPEDDSLFSFEQFSLYESMLYFFSLAIPDSGRPKDVYALFIWTTFITSIWVWLYFLAQLVTRMLKPFRSSIKFLQYALPIEKFPLRSIGAVMGFLACITTWVIVVPRVL